MKLFIAIPATSLRLTSENDFDEATYSLAQLGPSIRPVRQDRLHITLKFLGDTSAEVVPALITAMSSAVRDFSEFECSLTSVGVFPHRRRASVVWAAVHPKQRLQQLATSLADRLQPLGFQPEAREFTPHVTLARIKGETPIGLDGWLDNHATTDFGGGAVTAIQLIRSDATDHGQTYSTLATIAMAS